MKEDTDDSLRHDATDTYIDETAVQDQEFEAAADTDEVQDAEDAAVNIDNDSARLASAEAEETPSERAVEDEIEELDEELKEGEKKHKGRESTSEKAKKSTRKSTSEKAKEAEEIKKAALDPLRLRSKAYKAKVAMVDKTKAYTPEEAIELVKQTSIGKFDAAVELHAKVKTEGTRGTVVLPGGAGKTRKVAVADDETIDAIAAGKLDFDVLLATPAQMPKLAKYAKILGPKGLMPSPKAGTVTDDIDRVKEEISGGRVEYRADKNGMVHMSIGRVSFDSAKLLENFRAVEQLLISAKILSMSLTSTMGPGVKVVIQ